jgi:hypothetical protein
MKNIFMIIALLSITCVSMGSNKNSKHEKGLCNSSGAKTNNQVIVRCTSDLEKIIRDAGKKIEPREQEAYFCERVEKLIYTYKDVRVIENVLADILLRFKKNTIIYKQ